MNYAHYLITRFNLPMKVWGKDKNNVATGTDEWLDQRVDLFRRYCLPSVAAQTSKDFVWLLLFWDKTPEKYKRMNEEWAHQYKFYKPCYLTDEQAGDVIGYINDLIRKEHPADVDYVLTTRLDNDDSLAVDAMEEIEACLQSHPHDGKFFINLLHGIQYHARYNMSVVIDYKSNHFATMAEPASDRYKTAYGYDHTKIAMHHPVVNAGLDRVMWMERCHERNVDNDFHARWMLNPIEHGFEAERFNFSPPPYSYNKLLFRVLHMIPGGFAYFANHRIQRLKRALRKKH